MPKHIILTDAALELADIIVVPRSAVPQVIQGLEPGEYTVRNTSAPVSGAVTGTVVTQPPVVTTPASITPATGLQVGDTATLNFGAATGVPTPAMSFRLLRGGVNVSSQVAGGQIAFAQAGSYVLEVTWTNAHGTAQSVTSAVTVEEVPLEPQIRVASDINNRSVHSGHSLTDAYTYGNGWPGDLNHIRDAIFGDSTEGPPLKIGRSTIPGSPMSWRWENLSSDVDERRDAADFDTLMITEGGPPPRTIETTAMAESLDYLCRFAANQVVNGGGDEVILWSIWPALQGPGTDDTNPTPRGVWEGFTFRSGLEEYWRSFRYMSDYATWKIKTLYPALPSDWRVWLFPGDRWMAQLYDDIQAGTAPGFTVLDDVFSDFIHPDNPAMYGLGCFVATCLYQVDLREVDGMYIPETVTQAQAEYFWQLAWDIAGRFEPVGMGGSEGITPVWTPAMGDPLPDWTFDGATPPDPVDPVDPEPEEPEEPPPAGGSLPSTNLVLAAHAGGSQGAARAAFATAAASRISGDVFAIPSGFAVAHAHNGAQTYIAAKFSLEGATANFVIPVLAARAGPDSWSNPSAVLQYNGYVSNVVATIHGGGSELTAPTSPISGVVSTTERIAEGRFTAGTAGVAFEKGAFNTPAANPAIPHGPYTHLRFGHDPGEWPGGTLRISALVVMDRWPTEAERAGILAWLDNPEGGTPF